ncbi:MAG TPA: hypothetical protein VIA63_09475 [Candidatus Limnocylindria bacterium]|jgi:hypothetical protein
MRTAILLALVAFAVYMSSFRTIASVDPDTNALLAYSLVRDRDPYLDEFAAERDRISFWSFVQDGHLVAPYPPGAALFATPLVATGVAAGIVPPQTAAITIVAKSAGALAAAMSVAFVFLLAARVSGRRLGLLVASLYAFGTVTWPISAGALWQHGPAQLFLAAGLLWSYPGSPAPWAARSGLAFAIATVCRLSDALYAAAAFAYVAVARRPILARFVVWAAPAAIALLAYDVLVFHDPFDLRYLTYNFNPTGERNPLVGVAGNLVAPNRGLFVYSPFLVFAAYELLRRSWKRERLAAFVAPQMAAAGLALVLYGASTDWWGGYGYGNRYLADALPLFALGLALWLRRNRRDIRARIALAVTAVPSVIVAALGAMFYDWTSWSWERSRDLSQAALQWSLDPTQIGYTASRVARALDAVSWIGLATATASALLLVRLWSSRRPRRSRPLPSLRESPA